HPRRNTPTTVPRVTAAKLTRRFLIGVCSIPRLNLKPVEPLIALSAKPAVRDMAQVLERVRRYPPPAVLISLAHVRHLMPQCHIVAWALEEDGVSGGKRDTPAHSKFLPNRAGSGAVLVERHTTINPATIAGRCQRDDCADRFLLYARGMIKYVSPPFL